MKLATVNPRLDNIEGLLSKDVRTRDLVLHLTNKGVLTILSYYQLLRFPGAPSSSLGFPPEMMHPQLLQLSQPGRLVQGAAAAGMASPDVFRRIMQAQLSAKDDGGGASQVSISVQYGLMNELDRGTARDLHTVPDFFYRQTLCNSDAV